MVLEVPDWVRAHIRGTKKLTVIGAHCPYCVVAPELGTGNGFPEIFTIHSEGFFAVSEAYPAKWQELGVAHEFIEHALLSGVAEEDRCFLALQLELGIAEKGGVNMKEYLEFRFDFFNNLVIAYQAKKTKTPEEEKLLKRLKRSRSCIQDRLYDVRGA